MSTPSLPVGTKVTPASTAHPFYGKVFVVIKEIVADVEDGAEHVIAEIEGFAHTVEVKLLRKDVAVSAPAPVTPKEYPSAPVVETPAPEVTAEPVTATTAPEPAPTEPSTGTPVANPLAV